MIILSTMCKNQGNRLEEWILYHNKLGVQKFVIFLDNCTDNSREVLENIKEKYEIYIDIFHTEILDTESQKIHWIQRSHKMYDFTLREYTKISSWIVFIEVDEFILQKTNINLKDFLENLDTKCVYINSWDFKGPFNENQKILSQSYECWTDEERFNNGYRWRGKSIIRPKFFNKCMDAHHFRMIDDRVSDEFKVNRFLTQKYHGKEVYIDDDIFIIGHFRNHSPETSQSGYTSVKNLIQKEVAIVGAGWYGCYIAEYLLNNFKHINIKLIEKNDDIFSESSSKNQNRLHLGFHYPRCEITRNKCKKYYSFFQEKYNELVSKIEKNYYVISKDSKVTYENYLSKYDDYITVDNNTFQNIEGSIINTKEYLINFKETKKYFKNFFELHKDRISFKFNYEVHDIKNLNNKVVINDTLEFDRVFNATYNQIPSHDDVIYEKCLTLLYKNIKDISFDCLTIMDGNFPSLYKYDNEGIYTLTDVKNTPLIKGSFKEIRDFQIENLKENISLFEENITHYYAEFKNNFEYHGFYESYKCKNISDTDSRDINIKIDGNIFNVWCGKISFIFEMDDIINKFIY